MSDQVSLGVRSALVSALVLGLGLGCAGRAPESVRGDGAGTHRFVGPGDRLPPQAGSRQRGRASFYANRFHGRKTASGERFDMNAMTCAHRTLPFGTRVRVRRLDDGRAVTVRVNDRGPYGRGRIVDLSLAGAKAIGMVREGVLPVELTVLEVPPCRRRKC